VRKPRRCPACKHRPFATIVYGMPYFDGAERCDVEAGRILLAGCVLTDDDPAWACAACGIRMWRDGRIAGPDEGPFG